MEQTLSRRLESTSDNPIDARTFCWILAILIGLGGGVLIPWVFNLDFKTWPFNLAIVIALLSLPMQTAIWVKRSWIKLSHFLGLINGFVFSFLFYFLVLTPYGLLMRGMGKRPLQLQFEENAQTYLQVRGTPLPHENLDKPY
ncbi:MAG: SxtJ family membrane protein [Bdellovibrionales bacterium]